MKGPLLQALQCAQGDSNSHGPNRPQGPQPCRDCSAPHQAIGSCVARYPTEANASQPEAHARRGEGQRRRGARRACAGDRNAGRRRRYLSVRGGYRCATTRCVRLTAPWTSARRWKVPGALARAAFAGRTRAEESDPRSLTPRQRAANRGPPETSWTPRGRRLHDSRRQPDRKGGYLQAKSMARARIELATPRFSVVCSTN